MRHSGWFKATLAAGALVAAYGCSGDGDDGAAAGAPPAAPAGPAAPSASIDDCASIAAVGTADTVLTATTVAADTVLGGSTLPSHCLVHGQMSPRVGADGKRYAIGFELRLPKSWNGRFFFQGGGGNDGAIRPAIGAQTGQQAALARGFAVVSTDAGHQGTDATFGLDPQARVDHAYNSYEKVTVAAKRIVGQVYGRAPERSYFVGCSGGGRQALLFPQRFPEHFDGIVATAPAMKVAKEASVASVWSVLSYTAAAPRDAGGNPILSQALSDADLALLSNAILSRCDALDGAADGIVGARPARCDFDPAVLQCPGAKTASCLSAEQVGALRRDFGGPRDSQGRQLYATWPWDAGVRGADWRRWKLGTSATAVPDARNVTLIADDAMKYEFFTPPEPRFDYRRFDFDTDPARMDAYASIYHTTSTDVSAFRNRGGKMLLVHGVSDAIFSANDTIGYHERLTLANGGDAQTRGFARLFLVPGMNHCSGGPATDQYDALAPLQDWVERGVAPDRIVAHAGAGSPWPGRSRPLCPYPQVARYQGSGSLEEAASFSCAAD